MKNLEVKRPEEKGELNTNALDSLGMSSKAAIKHEKIRKSCWAISLKGEKQ